MRCDELGAFYFPATFSNMPMPSPHQHQTHCAIGIGEQKKKIAKPLTTYDTAAPPSILGDPNP